MHASLCPAHVRTPKAGQGGRDGLLPMLPYAQHACSAGCAARAKSRPRPKPHHPNASLVHYVCAREVGMASYGAQHMRRAGKGSAPPPTWWTHGRVMHGLDARCCAPFPAAATHFLMLLHAYSVPSWRERTTRTVPKPPLPSGDPSSTSYLSSREGSVLKPQLSSTCSASCSHGAATLNIVSTLCCAHWGFRRG